MVKTSRKQNDRVRKLSPFSIHHSCLHLIAYCQLPLSTATAPWSDFCIFPYMIPRFLMATCTLLILAGCSELQQPEESITVSQTSIDSSKALKEIDDNNYSGD